VNNLFFSDVGKKNHADDMRAPLTATAIGVSKGDLTALRNSIRTARASDGAKVVSSFTTSQFLVAPPERRSPTISRMTTARMPDSPAV
jgi:hypothetical protein